MILHVEDDVQDDSNYFTNTIFRVCIISSASSRHKYTPDGKPEASSITAVEQGPRSEGKQLLRLKTYRTVLTQ